MKTLALSCFLVGAIGATAVFAAPPAGAPSDSHGMCNDGTYSSSLEKKGACRGHKGVKEWYGEAAAESTKGTESKTTTVTKTPVTGATNEAPATTTTRKTSTTTVGAAPGGGAGQVWVNDSTKVYHCSGDKWYGKTKHGQYMSESDAKAKGIRADHGKVCS